MYGGFLYRLNYEEYKKKEAEIDVKLKKLSEEDEENEDFAPIEEAYIIKLDTEDEDFYIQDSGYFVLLVGDYDFNYDYADDVIYGLEESYARYVELKNKSKDEMNEDLLWEKVELKDYFTPYQEEEVAEIIDEILEGEADYGEVIKQIF